MEGKALWEVSNTVGRLFAVGGAFQCTARGGGRQGFAGGGLATGICSVLGMGLGGFQHAVGDRGEIWVGVPSAGGCY